MPYMDTIGTSFLLETCFGGRSGTFLPTSNDEGTMVVAFSMHAVYTPFVPMKVSTCR